MGHAFQDTLMDILIRYHRMQGYQTLWQGGCDHAGIATEMVVEHQLRAQNTSKQQLGRAAFIDKIWEWKARSGNTISQQMRRLGTSIDWSREHFTLDETLSAAVKTVFITLYQQGLIYKGQRLVNWDPALKTAVSDLEVVFEEKKGHLWHIRYPIAGEDTFVTVATTRPETLFGDAALAVHPNDSRYQHLIGKQAILPLCQRLIPIIADSFVTPEFGTGCVKITPAHDFNDHDIGKRHQLEMINIFTKAATLNNQVPQAYQGLDRFLARDKVIQDLKKANLLVKEEPHTLKIPRADRSGEVIEPLLTDQWFVKTKPLAKAAIQAVEDGQIKFFPDNWKKTYYEWMRHIEDWCISRQIWWGHRIPAWYDNQNRIYVGESEQEVRQQYKLGKDVLLSQEEDVLDTWFSAALWPFAALGWPSKDMAHFYPTQVLVTGFDIIFFWVARMVMMGLKFKKAIPFQHVFIHGLIQDPQGQKMSKSKGNVLDPIDLIDGITLEDLIKKRQAGLMQPKMAKQIEHRTRQDYPQGISSHGADPLRFTFCALASNNRHIRFDLKRLAGYRNFCNKIWNATRFVLMQTDTLSLKEGGKGVYERWIRSQLARTQQNVKMHLAHYRFDLLAQALYDFTWSHYCDWYLEFSKITLKAHANTPKQQEIAFTLVATLEVLLRLLHPVMPFITEEILQKLKPSLKESYFAKPTDSIMMQPYPDKVGEIDEQAEMTIDYVQGFVMGIRALKAEIGLKPNQMVSVLCRGEAPLATLLSGERLVIEKLAKVKEITWVAKEAVMPICATTLFKDLEIYIPLAGLIDQSAECQRLQKEITKLAKEVDFYQKKLNNPNYTHKAPAHIVEKEAQRLDIAKQNLDKLSENYEKIKAL